MSALSISAWDSSNVFFAGASTLLVDSLGSEAAIGDGRLGRGRSAMAL
ncbi:hypothetical protein ABZ341_24210 [Streptomyces sp. NPDC006173]